MNKWRVRTFGSSAFRRWDQRHQILILYTSNNPSPNKSPSASNSNHTYKEVQLQSCAQFSQLLVKMDVQEEENLSCRYTKDDARHMSDFSSRTR